MKIRKNSLILSIVLVNLLFINFTSAKQQNENIKQRIKEQKKNLRKKAMIFYTTELNDFDKQFLKQVEKIQNYTKKDYKEKFKEITILSPNHVKIGCVDTDGNPVGTWTDNGEEFFYSDKMVRIDYYDDSMWVRVNGYSFVYHYSVNKDIPFSGISLLKPKIGFYRYIDGHLVKQIKGFYGIFDLYDGMEQRFRGISRDKEERKKILQENDIMIILNNGRLMPLTKEQFNKYKDELKKRGLI